VLAVVRYFSDEQDAGRVPRCPSCRGPVRAGEYPRGLGRSPAPWNADWRGVCDQCGFQFSMTHELDSLSWVDFERFQLPPDFPLTPDMRLRRRVVACPASQLLWSGHESQFTLAGIEIRVEDKSFRYPPRSERYFLTKEEAAWLVRALQGPLAISFEQYHWDFDAT
jgi:hypothetical protein